MLGVFCIADAMPLGLPPEQPRDEGAGPCRLSCRFSGALTVPGCRPATPPRTAMRFSRSRFRAQSDPHLADDGNNHET